MVNCKRCGKRLGFFETTFSGTDKDGTYISYCVECHDTLTALIKEEVDNEEKKAEQKKKRLIQKLTRDPLMMKYVENEYYRCFFPTILLKTDKRIENFINDDRVLSVNELVNANSCLNRVFFLFKSRNNNKYYYLRKEDIDKLPFYITECREDKNGNGDDTIIVLSYVRIPLNLMKIVAKKYGFLRAGTFFTILHNTAKMILDNQAAALCEKYKTREQIYSYIINEYKPFVDKNESDWVKEFFVKLLNKMNNMGIVYFSTIEELRADIITWEENNELEEYQKDLVNPKVQEYGIEDVDIMNGFEFEGFLSKLFTRMGYKVENTKLSCDQGADLIVERNNRKTVIQAKRYTGKIGNNAVQEVVAAIKYYHGNEGMIVTNSLFTPSAKALADTNEIILIDRHKLIELMKRYFSN